MSVTELQASSIHELVDVVLKIRAELGDDGFLWYRGQSCQNYRLLPKLMRDGKSDAEVFERETRLLTRFRQRSMAYWPTGYPQTSWEHLFAMQHHGAPTRLLDWTENLFVACYFALSSDPPHADHVCVPSIWCVDPVRWNRSTPVLSEYGDTIRVLTTADEELESYMPETQKRRGKSPVAMFGAHNSDRIVAQRGTFVVWGADPRPLEEFASPSDPTLLWRVTLNAKREDLFKDLQTLGFTETMIFPELPYLATELARTEGWRT
ncbi:MAG: FRG domain-containing protein [Deltaproteobacteria bacterium]|nr:FRG domain-containing protein [Deltaproteobacteria bacterium]MBK8718771.1 FRG domain-containing protein [Deltaproteobacteria bacterium]MBP7286484.1 FRG domain-containing protein [Nannocystaceae bacterium]